MIKECECGKTFKTYPSTFNRVKYCSKECRAKYRIVRNRGKDGRIKLICKCGKEFLVYPYRVTGKGNDSKAQFCSKKCWGLYGSFGHNKGLYYGSESKMGILNPMVVHGISPEHLESFRAGAKKYQDSIRVSKEHKLMVKRILEYERRCSKNGKFTVEEWVTLKGKYHYTCPSCGKKEPLIKLTVDHIVPLSKGGLNTIENIQPLCLPCNCSKHNRSIEKYEII